jgi:hypothetical protein
LSHPRPALHILKQLFPLLSGWSSSPPCSLIHPLRWGTTSCVPTPTPPPREPPCYAAVLRDFAFPGSSNYAVSQHALLYSIKKIYSVKATLMCYDVHCREKIPDFQVCCRLKVTCKQVLWEI